MAFGLNATNFSLKEPAPIQIGTITSPAALDPAVTDPDTLFTSLGDVGYRERGSSALNMNDAFAEFLSGTPSKVIRQDLTSRDVRLMFNLGQFGFSQFATFLNVETFTNGTREGYYLGSDQVTPALNAFRMELTLTNDELWKFLLYSMKSVTEDKSFTWSGDAHATIAAENRAFPETNIEALGSSANDTKNYGIAWRDF